MLRILGRKNSGNVQKVLWCCDELGLTNMQVEYGANYARVNDEPDYLALNPNGLVPTIVDGDFVLWESNTILRYLAARYGQGQLIPEGVRERALMERWMDWQLSFLNPAIGPLFLAMVRGTPEEKRPQAIKPALERTTRAFAILDGQLKGRNFVGGANLTVADVALGIFAYRWFEMPIERAPLPALEAWYRRLAERVGFREHVMIGLG